VFAASDSSSVAGELDQIHFWEVGDKIDFGIAGSAANYSEITSADYATAQTDAASLLSAGREIVAVQVGSDVVVFTDDNAVAIVGANLDQISASNFVA